MRVEELARSYDIYENMFLFAIPLCTVNITTNASIYFHIIIKEHTSVFN